MQKITKKILWYIRLVFIFAKLSLKSELTYRLNFIAGSFVEIAYMLIKLTYLVVVVRSGKNIGILTPDMVIIFIGTYIFMTSICMLLAGLSSLPGKVMSGKLDMLIIKPGSLRFLQTFEKFSFSMAFPNFIVGIILIVIGWQKVRIPTTLFNIFGFIFFIIMSLILTYAITIIPTLLVFWIANKNGISTIFNAIWDFNNMPMTLYNRTVQEVGTFIIPILMITNWAGLFVLGKLSFIQIIWGIICPFIILFLSKILWKKGIKKYSSVNA